MSIINYFITSVLTIAAHDVRLEEKSVFQGLYVLNTKQLSVLGHQYMQEGKIAIAISLYAATVLGFEKELKIFFKKRGREHFAREDDKERSEKFMQS